MWVRVHDSTHFACLSTQLVRFSVTLLNITKKEVNILRVLNNIFSELKKQNRKQKELTDFIGISKNVFTDWKSGKNKSYMKYLPLIAEFLGVSVDYLLDDGNKKSPDTSLDSEMSERDRDAARLYRALIASGYVREGETLTPEQVGTLKSVITLLDASFGKGNK